MAVDAFIYFVKALDGMAEPAGETKDQKYSKTTPPSFEIKDFSFGVENPTTIGSATGGAGAGKIKFNEFTIKKTTDSASPAPESRATTFVPRRLGLLVNSRTNTAT